MSAHGPSSGSNPEAPNENAPLSAAIEATLLRELARPLAPGLYLVATPIGHLADMTIRALSVLARVDVIYCEDKRHSIRLFQHYGLERPLATYHDHNGERERPRILEQLQNGRRIALISDAGTPLVSDPGFKLVRAARDAGHDVWSIPGPSALLAALTTAGVATDRFHFEGFLPPRQAARLKRIARLAQLDTTLLFYEAPQRLADTLADLANELGPREAAVARELTKLHETVRRGRLDALAAWAAAEEVRGEIVIVVAPADAAAANVEDRDIEAALASVGSNLTLRDAVRAVAEQLGVPRGRVYEIGLRLKQSSK